MYRGTMIEALIATVERAECWAAANPAEDSCGKGTLPRRRLTCGPPTNNW